MTLEARVTATTGGWDDTHKPIVVGVDGSERNRSAVAWAAAEAAAVGAALVLVTVTKDRRAHDMLAAVRAEVQQQVPEQRVEADVVPGSPADALLDRSTDARMTVVGKRGLGGFARLLVGSTSIALAGRSEVPVTIVPDDWKQADHGDDPVIVGVDPERPDAGPIRIAFQRARRLGVRLVAVHGWVTPTAYSWDTAALAGAAVQWERDAHAEFDTVLELWRERFPDVEVEAVHSHSHPAMAVLDAAEHAQLVVLGRHTDGRLGGFPFGSVTRAVLHYSECPVMVVPVDS
ncbi:MAG TPA: universal stress protein [Nocardioidaceae bacterium]|nr:universal stress protein [Nocardioidaceae bacterium]